jgi:hypothetical protein
MQNLVFRSTTGAATAVGDRYVAVSLGQTTPVNCRSEYASAVLSVSSLLPDPSGSPTSSGTPSSLPLPSSSPTSLLIAVEGTPDPESSLAPTSGAPSSASFGAFYVAAAAGALRAAM